MLSLIKFELKKMLTRRVAVAANAGAIVMLIAVMDMGDGTALVRFLSGDGPALVPGAVRAEPTLEDLYLHVFDESRAEGGFVPLAGPAAAEGRGRRGSHFGGGRPA